MKQTKNNAKSLAIKAIASTLIIAALIAPTFLQSNSKLKPKVYTTCADEEYYSETTYYFSKDLYEQSLDQQLNNNVSNKKSYSTLSKSLTLNSNEEFICGVNKNAWVSEERNEDGLIINSHLMTKAEVDKLYESQAQMNDDVASTLSTGATLEYIGSESQQFHRLSLSFSVIYDKVTETYNTYANAGWEAELTWMWDGAKAAEESALDYLGITWGGDGYLEETNHSISGQYHDNAEVFFSTPISDHDAGYAWQFFEKSGWMGKEMKSANAIVSFKNKKARQNKTTETKLTYIHTYNYYSGTVTISASSSGDISASLTLTPNKDYWQIEIEIPNINY